MPNVLLKYYSKVVYWQMLNAERLAEIYIFLKLYTTSKCRIPHVPIKYELTKSNIGCLAEISDSFFDRLNAECLNGRHENCSVESFVE